MITIPIYRSRGIIPLGAKLWWDGGHLCQDGYDQRTLSLRGKEWHAFFAVANVMGIDWILVDSGCADEDPNPWHGWHWATLQPFQQSVALIKNDPDKPIEED